MRTTVTLDDDLAATLQEIARSRRAPFKQVLNEAIRVGLRGESASKAFTMPTHALGVKPGVDLTHALRIASDLEDDEIKRKLDLGK